MRCKYVLLAIVACGVVSMQSAAPAAERSSWPRVFVSDPGDRMILRYALERAATHLQDARCQAILEAFTDQNGQPLAQALARVGTTAADYLRLVVFTDTGHEDACGRERLATTVPGMRVVFVCASRFDRTWRSDPEHAEAVLIHEALHTLGLGETPPSSEEITNAVRRLCGARHSRRTAIDADPILDSRSPASRSPIVDPTKRQPLEPAKAGTATSRS